MRRIETHTHAQILTRQCNHILLTNGNISASGRADAAAFLEDK